MSETLITRSLQVTGRTAIHLIEQLQAGGIHTNNQKTVLDLSCLCRTLLNTMQATEDGALDNQQTLQIIKRLETAASDIAGFTARLSYNKLTLQAFEEASQKIASSLTEINRVFSQTR